MVVRFISDLHLGHTSMAIKRGFESAEEHDQFLIKSWNSIVKSPKDIIYILGDITMERAHSYHLLDKLFGVKHVVLGNHDRKQDVYLLLNHAQSVSGMINYKKEFILTHCPIHPCELEYRYRYKYNIHGHVHENSLPDNRYINVSAEVMDYKPKTIEDLLTW